MFCYLSKKIAIPNNVKLASLGWNLKDGYISCGGEGGLLKVLKLDSGSADASDPRLRGVAAPSNLTMNQTLDGHEQTVKVCTWNPVYKKLTTSDESGLIIVWMLHIPNSKWYEEMINNSRPCPVADMKWNPAGRRICIAYVDGGVICGSVDGNRLWGKELSMELAFVEWSPDSRLILFATTEGKVYAYDSSGTKVMKMKLHGDANETAEGKKGGTLPKVAGIHWYDGGKGYLDPLVKRLAVAFENGIVQLTVDERDPHPVVIDTMMRLTHCSWNANGTVLALAGVQTAKTPSGDTRSISMVQFYDPYGDNLRSLKVPGPGITNIAWEGNGLRLALAVDAFIYFANIRPEYRWGYFANTLVYAFSKPGRPDQCVVFWDTRSAEKYVKYIKRLVAVKACPSGENCVLATRVEGSPQQHVLILCNAIGSPVDSKHIEFAPTFLEMSKFHVVAANEQHIYVWQYRTSVSKLTSFESSSLGNGLRLKRKDGREKRFHVDDMPTMGRSSRSSSAKTMTADAIACVCVGESALIVARESGTIQKYSLPHISLVSRHVVKCRPQKIALNCKGTRVSIIDISGVLTFFDIEANEQLDFSRKDTWDMMWAEDNPELFCVMQKANMYVYRGLDPEEPVPSSGYLCQHNDLHIKAVLLDELINEIDCDPEYMKKCMLDFETKSLRDARQILSTVGVEEASAFIEENPHPRLWRLLAEAALEQLDFNVAEKAFVRCDDYPGIQLVKRLHRLDDETKQKAEVAAYFQRFDEAEALYRDIDRKDLAIDMRMRLGDWFRVVKLLQTGGGDDQLLKVAYNEIGAYYKDRQKWGKAVQFFAEAKNADALVECYYALEEFGGLEKLVKILPAGSPLLEDVGAKFQSVGMSARACAAYLKLGDVKAAIDCCVLLNQWDEAVRLAQEHQFPQIEGLLAKYAAHLLEKGDTLQAIELYRNAKRSTQAATLLSRLAQETGRSKVDPVKAKKLHVLAAMEVEEMRTRMLETQVKELTSSKGTRGSMSAAQTTAATLNTLMEHDMATGENRALDNAWKGAEAYHFYMMTQRQLYESRYLDALVTSTKLREYDDVLEPKDIHSLIALCAFYNRAWGQCSKAFIELESLKGLSEDEKSAYAELALSIFSQNAPEDPPNIARAMRLCEVGVPACVASGIRIGDADGKRGVYKCKRCSRKMIEDRSRGFSNCPLCHNALHN